MQGSACDGWSERNWSEEVPFLFEFVVLKGEDPSAEGTLSWVFTLCAPWVQGQFSEQEWRDHFEDVATLAPCDAKLSLKLAERNAASAELELSWVKSVSYGVGGGVF